MDLTCHVYKTERYVRWRLYNGAMHLLRGLSLIGTTGRTIRQEDYLLNDTRKRIIRWEDYERTRVKDVVILLLVSKRGESFRRLVT